MNKHNTEGYVLAYLLVAITIIGLVASALMASTLKVVQAQELSLQKTQSKYAIQGEVERFIADLDMLYPSSPIRATYQDNERNAIESAVSAFSDYLNDSTKFPFGNYPLLDKNSHSVTYDADSDFIVTDTIFSDNTTSISLQIIFAPEFEVTEEYFPPIADDLSTPQDETRAEYTNYSCTVTGARDFSISSYKITSTGGGT